MYNSPLLHSSSTTLCMRSYQTLFLSEIEGCGLRDYDSNTILSLQSRQAFSLNFDANLLIFCIYNIHSTHMIIMFAKNGVVSIESVADTNGFDMLYVSMLCSGSDWWSCAHVPEWAVCCWSGRHGDHWAGGKPPGHPQEADGTQDVENQATMPSLFHHWYEHCTTV